MTSAKSWEGVFFATLATEGEAFLNWDSGSVWTLQAAGEYGFTSREMGAKDSGKVHLN
ncbi:hypothetical protein FRC03_004032 [Tulasnella sp. 419]|nr:hypothetical protein FRC03_004032 [Tulasnella sp. 419]